MYLLSSQPVPIAIIMFYYSMNSIEKLLAMWSTSLSLPRLFAHTMHSIHRSLEARPGGLCKNVTSPYICIPYWEEIGFNQSQTSWGETREGASYNVFGRSLRMHRGLAGTSVI